MKDLLQELENSMHTFSAGQKRIAKLIEEKQMFVAFSSASEIGRQAEVSESTVIRFAQKLGFKGFVEFQTALQQVITEARIESREQEEVTSTSIVRNLLDADILSIQQLKNTLSEERLLEAVDYLGQASNIYVTSNFFDYGLAHSFAHWLNMVQGSTELLMQGDVQYYHQLSKLTANDVVVVFAFPRYTKNVMETVETAKEQGAKIIVITDNALSPLSPLADLSFFVPVPTNLSIDSYTAVHALTASIMRFLYVKEHDKVRANLDRVNSMYARKSIFIPPLESTE
ncbi:MurR/RpiR family transcriptional regulator [Paenisporosarcina cavernae]|uniref:MurR/RpiR family transcriptional regulator n=1 Tax=Paenisporosarcina cavernae TaxID=2320858 RepID=A0A385YRE3_9BACL|nr:MurR/RpiR family transcriptional regulator [Paenisporosarcina cavernae]AYC28567.1 MurR/RpiR family transcriptional regulator [Paenisporosarcina cavernae]